MRKKKGILMIMLLTFVILGVVGGIVVLGIDAYVKNTVKNQIISIEEAQKLKEVDCALVLGCQVRRDGSPSNMLRHRIERGNELYLAGAVHKLLMSGDHGRTGYNEVQVMKDHAMEAGISSEDIFMDHAGFSTYDSIYRARDVFAVNKMIIVSQEYHLYRALYIAEKLGVEAYGVAADGQNYSGQKKRNIREIFARVKDFGKVMYKPEPIYLGNVIPITGNGNATND